jgi:hypothetical protein
LGISTNATLKLLNDSVNEDDDTKADMSNQYLVPVVRNVPDVGCNIMLPDDLTSVSDEVSVTVDVLCTAPVVVAPLMGLVPVPISKNNVVEPVLVVVLLNSIRHVAITNPVYCGVKYCPIPSITPKVEDTDGPDPTFPAVGG